jgi:rare lipoprotein A
MNRITFSSALVSLSLALSPIAIAQNSPVTATPTPIAPAMAPAAPATVTTPAAPAATSVPPAVEKAAAPAAQAKAKAAVAEADSGGMQGKMAYYSQKFNGKKTANGERFNSKAMTMAHRTLAFGSLVRVTNTKNKKSVVVRVNDRGPSTPDRIGDVTRAAAVKLGMIKNGTADVTLKVVGKKSKKAMSKGKAKKKSKAK